jgi:guanosine-3',5'-bis(diphosphate) 3'-pyrophosphohydrolase
MTDKSDLQMLIKALAFASHKHKDQRRKDQGASPYINHPIALTNLLVNEGGITDAEILCAALLHDTVEDTETSPEELTEAFGASISGIVMEVTDDKSLPKTERKRIQVEHAPHLSTKAKAVKLADKTCNLRDVVESPPHWWPLERRQQYFKWGKQVIDGLRGEWPDLEAAFDQQYERKPSTI